MVASSKARAALYGSVYLVRDPGSAHTLYIYIYIDGDAREGLGQFRRLAPCLVHCLPRISLEIVARKPLFCNANAI